jgi:hypothetical protein
MGYTFISVIIEPCSLEKAILCTMTSDAFLALGAYRMQCVQISFLVPETAIECSVRYLLKFRQNIDLNSITWEGEAQERRRNSSDI